MLLIITILTVFLAGAWLSFSLPLGNLRFGTRLLIGAALSPLVVFLEFLLIRIIGVPFAHVSTSILVLNLPVLYLFYRNRGTIVLPDPRTAILCLILLSVPFIMVLGRYADPQIRAYYGGHVWMHTDVVYLLANGQLIVEEPELAGVRLSYPWAAHTFQAVASSLLNESPVFNYSWTALFYLVCVCLLAARIVHMVGGNGRAQAAGILWLCFGINILGYSLKHFILGDTFNLRVWGDYRYSPWVSYFLGFNQMIFALAMILALILLLISDWSNGRTWGIQTLIGLLLGGIALIYPILFPVACLAVAARIIAILTEKTDLASRRKHLMGLIICILASGLVGVLWLKFLGADCVSGYPVRLGSPMNMMRKSVEAVIVLAPLLIGAGFAFWRVRRTNRNAAFVLILGGVACTCLYIAFQLHQGANDYKFILAAGLFLFPFAPIALEPVMRKLNRWEWVASAVLVLVLVSPLAHKFYKIFPWKTDHLPRLERDGFDIQLAKGTRLAELFRSIRRETPSNAIVVIEESDLHWPTLTRRSLYVSPVKKDFKPGFNYSHNAIMKLRGYSWKKIMDRRRHVQQLLGSEDSKRLQALESILSLNRPVVIALDMERHRNVVNWLVDHRQGLQIHQSDGWVVWLIHVKRGNNGAQQVESAE